MHRIALIFDLSTTTDGATERANRILGQMLRQAVGPSQRDWVNKLTGIEFAMNSARSETTGFSPFFLNYGMLPRPLIWDNPSADEYPGVRKLALRIKEAIMQAHDAIIAARVNQTKQANGERRDPFRNRISGVLIDEESQFAEEEIYGAVRLHTACFEQRAPILEPF